MSNTTKFIKEIQQATLDIQDQQDEYIANSLKNESIKKGELPHLDLIYDVVRWEPTDVYEHLPTLRQYASKCDTICEFGTNDFTSTIALMTGFPATLVTLDIHHPDNFALSLRPWFTEHQNVKLTLDVMIQIAKKNNIDLQFINGSSLEFSFNSVDLLFIDSLHTYTQLSKELMLHAKKVKKYIILHDTEFYGEKGQDTKDKDDKYMCSYWETKGIGHALREFIENPYTGWVIDKHYENCHGLTILKRPWIV